MTAATTSDTPIWRLTWIRQHPGRFTGVLLHLILRTLFGIFWLAAGIHKIQTDWLTSDVLERMFFVRLTEMPPDSFAVFYLQSFAIPLYKLIAWIIVCGELYAAIGLLLGLTTRPAAAVSFFILINLAIGGYYDASLLPFFLLNIIFLSWPSGQWLGLDRWLNRRYPAKRAFR
jgi:thiosulfate dehydrogenase [quinone] large subunit